MPKIVVDDAGAVWHIRVMENYIVEYNGEPVTSLKFQSDGKADLMTGDMMEAIWYTAQEAGEVAFAIGKGAEAVRQ